jgi:hypothetical protein
MSDGRLHLADCVLFGSCLGCDYTCYPSRNQYALIYFCSAPKGKARCELVQGRGAGIAAVYH